MAENAMRYLAAGSFANRLPASRILLAQHELTSLPLHLTIIGHKDDPAAQARFQAALGYPASYKRLEWWDTREGRLRNPDVHYPELSLPAAFLCADRTCSPPIYQAQDIPPQVDHLTSRTMTSNQ
jgi:hypothetical protein